MPVPNASGGTARLLAAAALCSDAPVPQPGLDPVGDPTEVALVLAAEDSGLDVAALRALAPRTDTLPFESGRRLMATVHAMKAGPRLFVKGALEDVLRTCNRMRTDAGDVPLDAAQVHAAADAMAAQALRVLAVAEAETPPGTTAEQALAARECRLLGLEAMADPPRQDAIAAVGSCHRAGIDVKMVTGDHVRTATAVAAQVGLDGADAAPKAVTGAQLGDSALLPIDVVDSASIFARVTAEQKLRIVESLQRAGAVVAVTGDGVNDAPALRQADIGVAMGRTGTDAATEAADMVLTDDDFATIEAAVEEGRGVRDNVTKFITWTLPTNLAEGLVILTAILVGAALPILPVQILWINMTTAVALGLMLAFEPKEAGIMDRPPRDPNEPILTRSLVWRVVLVSVLTLAAAFGFFEYALNAGVPVEVARTIAVNTFVAIEIAYLFNCRSLDRPLRQLRFFSNPAALYGVGITIALQVLFTYTAPFQRLFDTAAIGVTAWLAITAAAIVSYVIVSVDKWVVRRRKRS
jgi:magnesium-transporting ATPase (P-type)